MAAMMPNSSGEGHSSNNTSTVVQQTEPEQVASEVVRLQLSKPAPRKKVSWTQETVDNEHMDKKKSKCCCVYVKPRAFDESESEDSDDGECDNCSGHVEKRRDGGGSSSQGGSHPGAGGAHGISAAS